MTEPRRVRTQVERDADGVAWRQTADTRPGYATWPQTAPGNPSWWRHDPYRSLSPVARVMAGLDGPPPVDGETCAKWCGYCHLGPGESNSPPPNPCGHSTFGLLGGEIVCTLPPGHDGSHRNDSGTRWSPLPTGFLISTLPPRRRWWHRLTRRAQ